MLNCYFEGQKKEKLALCPSVYALTPVRPGTCEKTSRDAKKINLILYVLLRKKHVISRKLGCLLVNEICICNAMQCACLVVDDLLDNLVAAMPAMPLFEVHRKAIIPPSLEGIAEPILLLLSSSSCTRSRTARAARASSSLELYSRASSSS